MRSNAGYQILLSQSLPKNEEVVLGFRESDQSWVVWYCHNKCNYYWGSYFSSNQLVAALKKFISRCEAGNPTV